MTETAKTENAAAEASVTETAAKETARKKLDATLEKKENLNGRALKWIFFFAFAGILLAVLLFLWGIRRSKPLIVSSETTVITEPLAPDGNVDYFAYRESRLPKEIGTDKNGFRVVCREIGLPEEIRSLKEENPGLFQKFCEKLGIDPNSPPPVPLTNFYEARDVWAAENDPNLSGEEREKMNPPFDIDRWLTDLSEDCRAFIEMWTEKNSPALYILTRELQKEIFVLPMVREDESQRLVLIASKFNFVKTPQEWGRDFYVRALWRIHQGDIDGALADYLTLKRLARTVQQDPNGGIIEEMLGIRLEEFAAGIGIGGNPDAPPTREQWQKLMDGIQSSEEPLSFKNALLNEQFLYLDTMQYFADAPNESIRKNLFSQEIPQEEQEMTLGELFPAVCWLGVDWSETACRFNHILRKDAADYAEILLNDLGQNYANSDDERTLRPHSPLKLLTLKERTEYVLERLTRLFAPGLDASNDAVRRVKCWRNLTKIGIALQLYAADHDGKLPPAWTVDENSKPLHSWRTLILPYLGPEAKKVYDQIKLGEPWDSEANKQFHQYNIPEFRCPAADFYHPLREEKCPYPESGETTYSVVVGPDTLFGTDGIGREMTPRHSSSGHPRILVVERCDPVIWMKPDAEITQETAQQADIFNPGIDKNQPNKIISGSPASFHIGGINAAMADGSVRIIYSDGGEDDKKMNRACLLGPPNPSVNEPEMNDSPSTETVNP